MQLAGVLTVLLVPFCLANPPPAERWVWGRRQKALPSAVAAVATAALVPPPTLRSATTVGSSVPPSSPQPVAQRRLGLVTDNTRAPVDTTVFKSITARSFPATLPHNTLRAPKQYNKLKFAQKTSVKQSPVDTTFTSHFDVLTNKPSTNPKTDVRTTQSHPVVVSHAHSTKSGPTLITLGEYPYSYDAKPIDLGDGTSIGWAPQDTLLIHEKHSSKKPSNQFEPPRIAEDHDTRYTTLDKLFASRGPTQLPDPHTLSNDILNGLHPDEVYYGNNDFVVIKGGGFHSPNSYHIEEGIDGVSQSTQPNINPSHTGNELGEANDITVTNVKPDEQFSVVPFEPQRYYNGNFPAIVRPTSSSSRYSNRRQRRTRTHSFRPLHQTSFSPLIMHPSSKPFYHASGSSQQVQRVSSPSPASVQTSNSPSNDGEEMLAQPSQSNIQVVVAPTKRSADSSVVSYHYQSRGSGVNAHRIVDYKIHREGTTPAQQQHAAAPRVQNQNIIQLSHKGRVQYEKQQPPKTHNNRFNAHVTNEFEELEDLAVPVGASILVPEVQIRRKRPSSHAPPPSHFVPSVHRPQHGSGPGRVTQKPISLAGDTRVNFLHPLPPVNRQAEFLGRRPSAAGNTRRQVRPVLVRNRGNPVRQGAHFPPSRPNNRRRQGTPTRFMEPRRRVSNRRRRPPTV